MGHIQRYRSIEPTENPSEDSICSRGCYGETLVNSKWKLISC